MGFGFNLFGFPFLLLSTIGLIAYAAIKRSWKPLLLVLGLWGTTVLMFIVITITDDLRAPIQLTRSNVIGEYQIDTNFFPGKNARWQFRHYKFSITNSDSILFAVLNDQGHPQKLFRHKIIYSETARAFWRISADSTHHIIREQPTLYRGHQRFYYVFKSGKYGNMFFRKQEQSQ